MENSRFRLRDQLHFSLKTVRAVYSKKTPAVLGVDSPGWVSKFLTE